MSQKKIEIPKIRPQHSMITGDALLNALKIKNQQLQPQKQPLPKPTRDKAAQNRSHSIISKDESRRASQSINNHKISSGQQIADEIQRYQIGLQVHRNQTKNLARILGNENMSFRQIKEKVEELILNKSYRSRQSEQKIYQRSDQQHQFKIQDQKDKYSHVNQSNQISKQYLKSIEQQILRKSKILQDIASSAHFDPQRLNNSNLSILKSKNYEFQNQKVKQSNSSQNIRDQLARKAQEIQYLNQEISNQKYNYDKLNRSYQAFKQHRKKQGAQIVYLGIKRNVQELIEELNLRDQLIIKKTDRIQQLEEEIRQLKQFIEKLKLQNKQLRQNLINGMERDIKFNEMNVTMKNSILSAHKNKDDQQTKTLLKQDVIRNDLYRKSQQNMINRQSKPFELQNNKTSKKSLFYTDPVASENLINPKSEGKITINQNNDNLAHSHQNQSPVEINYKQQKEIIHLSNPPNQYEQKAFKGQTDNQNQSSFNRHIPSQNTHINPQNLISEMRMEPFKRQQHTIVSPNTQRYKGKVYPSLSNILSNHQLQEKQSLKAQYEKTKKYLTNCEIELEDNKRILSQVLDRAKSLDQEVNKYWEKVSQIHNRTIDEYQNQMDELKKRFKMIQIQNNLAQKRVQEILKQKDLVKNILSEGNSQKHLIENINLIQRENEQTKLEFQKVQLELAYQQQERLRETEKLKFTINQLSALLKDEKIKRQLLQKEKNQLIQRTAQANKDTRDWINQYSDKQQQFKNLQTQYFQYKQKIQHQNNQRTKEFTNHKLIFQNKINQFQKQKQESKKLAQELTLKIVAENQRLIGLQNQHKLVKTQYEKLTEQFYQATKNNQIFIQEKQNQHRYLEEELSNNHQTMQILKNNLQEKQNKHRSLEQELSNNQKTIQILKNNLQEKQNQHRSLEQELLKNHQMVQILKNNLQEKQNQHRSLEQELLKNHQMVQILKNNLQEKQHLIKEQNQKYTKQVERLNQNLQSSKMEIEKYQRQSKSLQQEYESFREALHEQKQKVLQSYNRKFEQTSTSYKQLLEQANRLRIVEVMEIKAQCQHKQKVINELNFQKNKLIDDLKHLREDVIPKLNNTISMQKQQSEGHLKKLGVFQELVPDLQLNNKNARKKMEQQQIYKNELINKLNKLQLELNKFTSQMIPKLQNDLQIKERQNLFQFQQLNKHRTTVEHLQSSLNKHNIEYSEVISKLLQYQKRQHQWEQKDKQLNLTITMINGILQNKNKQVQILTNKNQDDFREGQNLKKQLNIHQEERSLINQQINNYKKTIQQLTNSKKQQINRYKNGILEIFTRNNQLNASPQQIYSNITKQLGNLLQMQLVNSILPNIMIPINNPINQRLKKQDLNQSQTSFARKSINNNSINQNSIQSSHGDGRQGLFQEPQSGPSIGSKKQSINIPINNQRNNTKTIINTPIYINQPSRNGNQRNNININPPMNIPPLYRTNSERLIHQKIGQGILSHLQRNNINTQPHQRPPQNNDYGQPIRNNDLNRSRNSSTSRNHQSADPRIITPVVINTALKRKSQFGPLNQLVPMFIEANTTMPKTPPNSNKRYGNPSNQMIIPNVQIANNTGPPHNFNQTIIENNPANGLLQSNSLTSSSGIFIVQSDYYGNIDKQKNQTNKIQRNPESKNLVFNKTSHKKGSKIKNVEHYPQSRSAQDLKNGVSESQQSGLSLQQKIPKNKNECCMD